MSNSDNANSSNMDSTSIGPPVFIPHKHPELRTLGKKAIRIFLKERARYEQKAAHAANQGSMFTPASIVASIDFELLTSLIEMQIFDQVTDIADLRDEVLLRWLQVQAGVTSTSFDTTDIQALLQRSVKFRFYEPNVSLRIISLFTDYKKFLADHGLKSLIDDNPKLCVKHITSLLQPNTLKKAVERHAYVYNPDLRTKFHAFFQFVLEKAQACDEFVTPQRTRTRDRTTFVPGTGPSKQEKKTEGFADDSEGNKPKVKEVPFCLNVSKCKGKRHYMNECTESTSEEKAALLKQYRESKGTKAKNTDRAGASINPGPAQKSPKHNNVRRISHTPLVEKEELNGSFKATLADCVEVTLNGDYGADHAILSEDHLKQLSKLGKFVPILELETPEEFELAVGGQAAPSTVQAHKAALITTTILTPEGPFRMRNVRYLVVREPMSEVLLSRPVLMSLGFNLTEHLSRIRSQFNDKDFSAIGYTHNLDIVTNSTGKLARVMKARTASFYGESTGHEDPQKGFSSNDESLPTADLRAQLDLLVKKAATNGLSKQNVSHLQQLLYSYEDIFRTEMTADNPVAVPPMKINIQKDSTPVRFKVRRYPVEQAEFLKAFIAKLETMNFIYRNPESTWASAPLIIPKPSKERWRFTVDLRAVNKVTVPHIWPMPNIETELSRIGSHACYATIDLCHMYWQFPLDKDSQECQSFITPQGVYTPKRVLQGQRNAVTYCQSTMQSILRPILESVLVWLDDLLMFAANEDALLNILEKFFRICRQYNVKLHALKCDLFLKVVKWCGRIISTDGVKYDPRKLNALLELREPKCAADLQQFLCAANWMRSCIPEYAKLTEPLHELLERAYKAANKRTKRAIRKLDLHDLGWEVEHSNAFRNMKCAIEQAVTLSPPDPAKAFCVFTDASDNTWSGLLTQVSYTDLDLPFEEQHHSPLGFVSGSFHDASSRWSTPEKEASAIINTIKRFDYYLLRPEGFHLFTDHSNLVFMFHPERTLPHLSRAVYNKVWRWSMLLTTFTYTIVHISSEDNCWADLLSRWGASGTTVHQATQGKLSALMRAPISPDSDPDFTWPTLSDIYDAQTKAIQAGADVSSLLKRRSKLLVDKDDRVWIPENELHLQLRICIVGHCGKGGHRGKEATLAAISSEFTWSTIHDDVKEFCKNCLHCVSTLGGKRIPRLLGHSLHSDKPNEFIHFDFLSMTKGINDMAYVLIIKDDASQYTWLSPAASCTTEAALQSLLSWFAAFGVSRIWQSDQGTHFKNTLMEKVNQSLHCHHNFTLPYTPQANGTVERVCRELLRCCRALLSEFRLPETRWPHILPIIQSVLNSTPSSTLNNLAPITVFTGLPPDNPLRLLVDFQETAPATLDEVRLQKVMRANELQSALQNMHKYVSQRRTKSRDAAVQRHNQKTNIQPVTFIIGDFVLIAKKKLDDGRKLQVNWLGPYRIISIKSETVFECEDLITGKTFLTHATRMKPYADSQLNVTEELLKTIAHNQKHYNIVTKLMGLRFNVESSTWEVQAKWRGFDDEEPTWEPLIIMHEDIPDMLREFLQSYPAREDASAALEFLRTHGEKEV